jgi:hypothetical protein
LNSNLIFWPVLLQILLILWMYGLLAYRKARAVKTGNVNLKATALDNKAWPADVLKVSNNIDNQFEVPIVFFVLCILFHSIQQVDSLVLALAWAYVISRYVHAYVHVGSNFVPLRMRIFTLGCLFLLAMTLIAAWKLLS